jgi:hypothetical protein
MLTIFTALVAALLGAVLGFIIRGQEFRREQRLREYGAFSAAFLETVHAGAGLASFHGVHADNTPPDLKDRHAEMWAAWADAQRSFEAATARLRMVATPDVRHGSETMEDFVTGNIRSAPPFANMDNPEAWGYAAKEGPSKVESEGIRLARQFADLASHDILGNFWNRSRRPSE